MTAPTTKLYLVVREDIPQGLQAAQLVHAAIAVCFEQREAVEAWQASSQNVACLAAPNRDALAQRAYEASCGGKPVSTFEEPDLGHELTAIAVLGERLFPSLPLALRQKVPV